MVSDMLKHVNTMEELATNDVVTDLMMQIESIHNKIMSDLESALDEIEQLRKSVTAAASAQGYDDFQNVVEDLKIEMKRYKSDANTAITLWSCSSCTQDIIS